MQRTRVHAARVLHRPITEQRRLKRDHALNIGGGGGSAIRLRADQDSRHGGRDGSNTQLLALLQLLQAHQLDEIGFEAREQLATKKPAPPPDPYGEEESALETVTMELRDAEAERLKLSSALARSRTCGHGAGLHNEKSS